MRGISAHIRLVLLACLVVTGCEGVTGPGPLTVASGDPTDSSQDSDTTGTVLPAALLLAQISGGSRMGNAGRTEQLRLSCVSDQGTGLASVSWTVSGETHTVQPPSPTQADPEPWTTFIHEVTVAVEEPKTVFLACTDTGGRIESARLELTALPPPAFVGNVIPTATTGMAVHVSLEPLPTVATTLTVASVQNMNDVQIRNDSLHAEAGSSTGPMSVRITVETAFGSGVVQFHGQVLPDPKIIVWTNTTSRLDFLDTHGRVVYSHEQDERASRIAFNPALKQAVSVRVTALDGNHFSVRRPFSYPDPGSTTIVNAYQVSMQPCREFEAAWGIPLTECRVMLAQTLFQGGYQRYNRRPEAVVVERSPFTDDRLPGDWERALENARLEWEANGVYMNRQPGMREVTTVRFRLQDGILVPAESGRIMILPDSASNGLELGFGTDRDGFLSGAMLMIPIGQAPGSLPGKLKDMIFRAWHPFTDSPRLDALPPARRSHFLAAVVAAIRTAEDGISGLFPGDRAGDVLIIP